MPGATWQGLLAWIGPSTVPFQKVDFNVAPALGGTVFDVKGLRSFFVFAFGFVLGDLVQCQVLMPKSSRWSYEGQKIGSLYRT